MSGKRHLVMPVLVLFALLGMNAPAHAQFGKLKDRLKQKVEQRVERKTDEAMEKALDKVECAATDQKCIDQAESEGKEVKVVSGSAAMKPGQGAWANYDFKPGDKIIFADDFSKDEVGDFPRRMEFKGGQVEIVEWNDGRWLRAAEGQFFIKLPQVLPERFTLEFDLAGNGNAMMLSFDGNDVSNGSRFIELGEYSGRLRSGTIDARGEFGAKTDEKPVHIAISMDGKHVKAYANEKRIFNAPNADLGRSRQIWISMNGWSADQPRMIANVRLAEGGKKLYDTLAEKGRVATQGILFDLGSDRIRPESTPTLKEIGTMLTEHADLKLLIEGHTDNVGNAVSNQTLSEKRAEAVRQYLIKNHGVTEARLQAKGFGASKPAASNDSAEGRQQNRRVELVKQ